MSPGPSFAAWTHVRPQERVARRARQVLLAAAALLLVLAGCTTSGASPSVVATTTVDLPPSYRFAPEVISVKAGATVTWTNHDNFTHSVSFDGSQPQMLSPGASTTRTFDTPGTYAYVCSLHPRDMRGTVTVTDG